MEVGEENVILNCDYHFDEEEAQQLEIKYYSDKVLTKKNWKYLFQHCRWYFNKDPAPFFQWIAGLPDSKETLKSYLYLLRGKRGKGNKCIYYFFIFNYQLLNDIFSHKLLEIYSRTELISTSWLTGIISSQHF